VRTAVAAAVPACLTRYGFGFAQVPKDERSAVAYEVDRPSEIATIVERLVLDGGPELSRR